MYLRKGRSPYLLCCMRGCRAADPLVVLKFEKYTIPLCFEHAHKGAYDEVKRLLQTDKPLKVLAETLSLSEIQVEDEHEEPTEQSKPLKKESRAWSWLLDYGYWIDDALKKRKISDMTTPDLIAAVRAIFDANNKIDQKDTHWITTLQTTTAHKYPTQALLVAEELVLAKLDEFRYELEERNETP